MLIRLFGPEVINEWLPDCCLYTTLGRLTPGLNTISPGLEKIPHGLSLLLA